METLRPDPDSVPRARRADPSTSHDAARRKNESGTAESDREELVRFVRWFPGRTIPGLAMIANQEEPTGESEEQRRQRYGRRAKEAEQAGEIHPQGERSGSRLWWPGPALEETPTAAQGNGSSGDRDEAAAPRSPRGKQGDLFGDAPSKKGITWD